VNWVSGWRLAVGTLTVFPVRPPEWVDRVVAGRAMLLAPLAVLPLAVLAAALGRLSWYAAWPGLLSGLVVVGVLAVGTRALHLDGLADTVDGLGSAREPDGALAIMRRGDVGPMGVVALILVLGAQVVAASALTADWRGAVLLAVLIAASRASLLISCRSGLPAARPDGLGATVAGAVSRSAGVVGGGLAGIAVLAATVLAGRPWWTALVAVSAAALVVFGLTRVARRRFGGITGDVLGAGVELSSTTLLLGALLG
jgi:adenosylcobinamide-GDP ribazoletransferase